METVSVSLGVLAGIIGKNGSELQSALMTEKGGEKVPVEQDLIDKFVADALRERLKDVRADGIKESRSAGRKSAFDEIEKHLKEHYGCSDLSNWEDGLSKVVDSAKSKAQTSEDAVKSSEAYKRVLSELQQREADLAKVKEDFRNKIVQDGFQREIETVLADPTLGLALPADATIRANQLASFRAFLSAKAKLHPTDDGNLVPVDANGKQLEDSNFLPVTLRSLITSNAKQFWPASTAPSERTAPPAGQDHRSGDTGGSGGLKFPAFKSAEEFSDFLDKAVMEGKDAKYMEEALAAYESQNQK